MGACDMIRKRSDGRWQVDVEPAKGKRYRKVLPTKAEAIRFESQVRSQHASGQIASRSSDKRTLLDLIDRWYQLHGHSLADAERRKSTLSLLCQRLGNPVAYKFRADIFLAYRRDRLDAGITGKTLNNELGYLRAVFSVLSNFDHLPYSDPLGKVKPLKLQERDITYLSPEQVQQLLLHIRAHAQTPHLEPVVRLCLATGARWSEALSMTRHRVTDGAVRYVNTKGKRVRVVPISPDLERLLLDHFSQHGRFANCTLSFRKAIRDTGIRLPKGQLTHVLRHTFAAHFLMGGGNILVLQRILGHSSVTITMRYAHLAPDHLQEAVRLNPLASFDTSSTPTIKKEGKTNT